MTFLAHMKTHTRSGALSRMTALALIVAFGVAAPAGAQNETPPAGGTPKPFVFPEQQTFTLDNGMMVTLVEYGSIPKVSFELVLRTGSKDDLPGKTGVSDMVGHVIVLFRYQ